MARRKAAALPAAKVALVHVARRQLALEDADYRSILAVHAGVTSARDLTAAGFGRVMLAFAALGFTSTSAAERFGHRPGFADPGHVGLIRELWQAYTEGQGTEATLGKWLHGTFGVSALRFLPAGQAPKAVAALRAMVARREAAAGHAAA